MKINFKILLIAAFLVTAPLLMLAQPHPNNGTAPTSGPGGNTAVGGTPTGPSAPIGSGTFLLITLAAAYAGRKIYVTKKEQE